MKKILLLLLAVLLAAALPCGSLADEEGDVYGVHWKLDGNATLTFTANGSDGPAMIFEGPWDAFGYKVNAVVFGEGVTDVWASLENLTGLTSVTFGPDVAVIDRCDLIDVAHLVMSDQHQVFGTFSGQVTLDDGSMLLVEGLRGFAEDVHNRY